MNSQYEMKKIYQRGTFLNAQILNTLIEVFNELNWDFEKEDRFNRYCKLISRLNGQEQQLIMELTRDFLYRGLNHYPAVVSQTMMPDFELKQT